MKNKNEIIIAGVVIAVAVAGFCGGVLYQKNQTPRLGKGFGSGAGIPESAASNITRRSGGLQGGFTSGDIISKDNNNITLKMRNGSTRIILYSDSTQISKQTSGTVDDLAVGASVMVTGNSNADGSVSAQTISLRPANSGSNPGNPVAGGDSDSGNVPASNNRPAAPVSQ